AGLPQSGQPARRRLSGEGGMDMSGRYGERGVRLQADGRPEAAGKCRKPWGIGLDLRCDYRMGGEGAFARARRPLRAAEQGAGGGADRVALEKLRKRDALAAANDLEEAEAVHRGPLERLGKHHVECCGGGLAVRLGGEGWEVDPDRAADAEAADRPSRSARTGNGERFRRKRPID